MANTGAVSTAAGCSFSCNAGFLKSGRACSFPRKGKYVNVSGSEQNCRDVDGSPSGGFDRWENNTAPVPSDDKCKFSCKSGFTKSESLFACNMSNPCVVPNGGGLNLWDTNTNNFSTTCTLETCNAGYDNSQNPTQCQTTVSGFYSPANDKNRKACSTIPVYSFATGRTGLSSPHDCWSCNSGFLKSGRACNIPRKGKYVNSSGSEKSCNDIRGTDGGFNEFLDNTKGVSSATGCNFSCKQNHVKSVSNYSCTQGLSCIVANGEGLRRTSSGSCEVVDCNAGYDSTQAPTTQCQETASGFFSLADDKTRTACPTPPHSSATTTTELSSADGCYTCDGGYLKNTARNTCDFPSKGKYVDASGTEVTCNPITTLQGGAIATWIGGAAADSAITCPFSCSAGFVKTGRACNIPDTGNYADGAGAMQSCSTPTGGFNTFLPNTGAVETATDCGFSCNAGFLKNTGANTCPIPGLGKYADGSGNEQSCDNPTGATGGFKEFLTNTAAVATATGCNFSCNVGFVKNTADSMCEIPDLGKYADSSGDEQTCNNPTGATGGFNTFLPNTGAVDSATGCGFSCNTGFVKSGRTCNFPSTGSFVNAQGTEALCDSITSITTEGAAVATWIAGAASTANTCPFSCTAGFVKSGRTCAIPDQGKYAGSSGDEQSCPPITGGSGGFDAFDVNMGAVDSATGCGFSCNTGFMKDSSGRACNFPSTGSFVNAQGIESSCTDITGIPNFNSWLSGAATDQDSCPFSCSSGHTASGRICREYIPQMLALGTDTSHVLFDNGEVEAWGKVSAFPWRSHIKEDLRINTPQAFVSGSNHQCIILKTET